MDYVYNLAGRIVSRGKIAVNFCKDAVNEGMQTDIDRAMTIEADLFGMCFATEDQKEGMNAFLHKTRYDFKGK
jgi:enoyl-CoA hydratase